MTTILALSIRETETGAVLLHCFADCGIDDVLGGLGMEFADLYPGRTDRMLRDVKRPRLSGWAVIDAISFRLTCITLLATKMQRHETFTDGDWCALHESIMTVQTAIAESRRVC